MMRFAGFARTLQKSLLCAAAILAAATSSRAADWPQFLGPNRNGVSSETGLIDAIPSGGLKPAWKSPVGLGMSGVAVAAGKVFTLVQADGKQQVVCLDAKTGVPAWKTSVAPAYRNQQGDGPRCTPTIAGGSAYVFTSDGALAAISVADGAVRWTHNVVSDLGGKEADYGMACSPLVVGDLVVVSPGAPKAALAAYKVDSGTKAWSVGDDEVGYSSPALLEVGGAPQIVACTGGSVIGVSPATGVPLWRHPYVTDFGCNTATPIAVRGKVLVSSGENHGSAMLKFAPDGDKFAVSESWSSLGAESVLRSEWQTPIHLDGRLYGMDNVGGAGPITHLVCLDAATGKRLWQKQRFGKGNLIAADGKLFISTIKGELVLVRATPEKFEELGLASLADGMIRQAPALADGMLYLRDDKEIVCVDVKKKQG